MASVAAPPALNFTPVNCARDIRIDLLRGYFFAIMTIAHMPEHPLSGAVRQTVGLVSVAEGFVFVSGLMFGMVYGRTLLRNGVAALRRRALKRAQDIYLNHAAVYTLVVFSAAYAGLDHRFAANFWGMWGRGLLMIYQPGLFFLLPMYFLFVLLGPLALEQMLKGRTLLVWLASLALWMAAQFGVGRPPLLPSWVHPGPFNALGFQILFVAGMYFGYRRATDRTAVPSSRFLLVASALIAAGFFVARHEAWLIGTSHILPLDATTIWKYNCHPLRLLNFAAVAYLIWSLPQALDHRMSRVALCRGLAFIGKHSLPVFAWSVVITYGAMTLQHRWQLLPGALQVLLAVAAASSLVIPAWLHQQYQIWDRGVRNSGDSRRASELMSSGSSLATEQIGAQ